MPSFLPLRLLRTEIRPVSPILTVLLASKMGRPVSRRGCLLLLRGGLRKRWSLHSIRERGCKLVDLRIDLRIRRKQSRQLRQVRRHKWGSGRTELRCLVDACHLVSSQVPRRDRRLRNGSWSGLVSRRLHHLRLNGIRGSVRTLVEELGQRLCPFVFLRKSRLCRRRIVGTPSGLCRRRGFRVPGRLRWGIHYCQPWVRKATVPTILVDSWLPCVAIATPEKERVQPLLVMVLGRPMNQTKMLSLRPLMQHNGNELPMKRLLMVRTFERPVQLVPGSR